MQWQSGVWSSRCSPSRQQVCSPGASRVSPCSGEAWGSPRTGAPDTPPVRRDSLRAQSLTQDAAALMDTDPDQAEAMLREALVADHFHGPAHNNLGTIHLERGELYEAAAEFEWARKLMPGHPDPRLNLAMTLERAGRIDDAIMNYESALAVYDGHIPTMQAFAKCQVVNGRRDASTRSMLEAVALQGESEAWRAWARWELSR